MSIPIIYSQAALLNALQSYINENEEIISDLQSVKAYAERCHRASQAAKAVCVGSGAVGTITTLGLFFAPLTGGLSLVASGVAMGLGAGSTVGGLMRMGRDYSTTEEAKRRLEDCQRRHERSVYRLKEKTTTISQLINQLLTGRAISILTSTQLKAVSEMSKNPKLIAALGKVLLVVNVFFTVVDVARLISSWDSEHPLVAPINEFINKLKESIQEVQNQINAIEQYINRTHISTEHKKKILLITSSRLHNFNRCTEYRYRTVNLVL